MALSKSTIKQIDRTELYFKKYQYRATIFTQGLMWVRSCKTIERFKYRVTKRYEEWEATKDRYPNGWYREPLSLEDHDLKLIEDIINIKDNLAGADIQFRHEQDTLSLYTNDGNLINLLLNHDPRWNVDQVIPSPDGVKYFKKDPPAKYRAYMSNNKVESDFCEEMLEYLNRTPDLEPSNAFYEFLHRRVNYRYSHIWLWNNHFIDYNDERNLMMMKLMFPKAIGKTYKLEKKPS